jgi:LysM repeat protein
LPVPTPTDIVPAAPVKHTVKPGDTLIAIAKTYDTTVKDIADANSLDAAGLLRIGQELLIPIAGPSGGPGPTATPDGGALMYVVQSGDTISTIAERFGSQMSWIFAANNMKPGDVLQIGRPLLVPLTASTSTPMPTPENTPTPTATIGPRLPAPVLLAPADGAVLLGKNAVLLTWAAPGTLAQDEWYVVTVKAVEVDQSISPHWTKTTSWRLPTDYRVESQAPTEFTWQVQVRQGGPDNPGGPASAVSEQRSFAWR